MYISWYSRSVVVHMGRCHKQATNGRARPQCLLRPPSEPQTVHGPPPPFSRARVTRGKAVGSHPAIYRIYRAYRISCRLEKEKVVEDKVFRNVWTVTIVNTTVPSK